MPQNRIFGDENVLGQLIAFWLIIRTSHGSMSTLQIARSNKLRRIYLEKPILSKS